MVKSPVIHADAHHETVAVQPGFPEPPVRQRSKPLFPLVAAATTSGTGASSV